MTVRRVKRKILGLVGSDLPDYFVVGLQLYRKPGEQCQAPMNTEKVLPLPALKNTTKNRGRQSAASAHSNGRLHPASLGRLFVPTQDVQNVQQVNEQPEEIQKQAQGTGDVLIRGQVVHDV